MDDRYLKVPLVIKLIAQRYKNGYSPIVLVCGKTRDGKTSKAYIFAAWLSWLLFKKPWAWRENTIVSVPQFAQAIASDAPGILIIDECQRLFSKKDVWSHESRWFDKLLTSQAYKHYIIFLILPRASALGTDHSYNVNYVIPIHHRTLCMPYKVDSNEWDIALKQKKINKFSLGHFRFDLESPLVKKSFKEELKELPEFKRYIEENIKSPLLDQVISETMTQEEEIEHKLRRPSSSPGEVFIKEY